MKFNRVAVNGIVAGAIAPIITGELDPIWGDSTGGTKLLPATYNSDSTFEYAINGSSQIFVHVHILVLGGGGLTGITLIIEFQDPDNPTYWIPSKQPTIVAGTEDVLRNDTLVNNEWVLAPAGGIGNYVVASRKEHKRFTRFRVRFRCTAGAPGATTRIHCYWHTDSQESMVPSQ
jgi:hypothetical protein